MIYFIHGDIPLQIKFNEIFKKIKTDNPNISEERFDMSQDNIDTVFQALSTDSMFIPKSLIIISRVEETPKFKDFIKSLKDFNFSKKIVIMLYEEKIDDHGKILNPIDKPENKTQQNMKNITNIAEVISARQKDEKKALQFFIEKELLCSEYEAKKIIEMVGEDFFKVKNEIEKIKIFLNGETLNLEKIKPILSISKEFNIFTLIENFLLYKKNKNLINFLKKEKAYILFMRILTDELITLYKLKDLEKRGIITVSMSYNTFKDRVYSEIKEYFIKNDKSYFIKNNFRYTREYPLFLKFKYLNKFSIIFLQKKLKQILNTEYSFMSGEKEMEISIETFILNFFN